MDDALASLYLNVMNLHKRLPYIRKLLSKLYVNKSFKFQQSTYKKVPISLVQSYSKKSGIISLRRLFFHWSFLKISVKKSVSCPKPTHSSPWYCCKETSTLLVICWITLFSNLQFKSLDWFLCYRDLRHERVKHLCSFICNNGMYRT